MHQPQLEIVFVIVLFCFLLVNSNLGFTVRLCILQQHSEILQKEDRERDRRGVGGCAHIDKGTEGRLVAQACNPGIWVVEAGVQGHPWLCDGKLEVSLGCKIPSLKEKDLKK